MTMTNDYTILQYTINLQKYIAIESPLRGLDNTPQETSPAASSRSSAAVLAAVDTACREKLQVRLQVREPAVKIWGYMLPSSSKTTLYVHVGGCQNYGPFLGP